MPTFIGKPVTVAEDKQLQVGDTLRDFNLTTTDLTKKSSDMNLLKTSYARYWIL